MSSFTFTPDREGIQRSLEQPGMAKFINQASGAISRAIKTRGPKRRSSFFRYRQGVFVMPAKLTRDEGMVGAVGVDSPGWHLPEYGTRTVSAIAPIRRGARDVAGVRFREE